MTLEPELAVELDAMLVALQDAQDSLGVLQDRLVSLRAMLEADRECGPC